LAGSLLAAEQRLAAKEARKVRLRIGYCEKLLDAIWYI
jgi:hypothetical protein